MDSFEKELEKFDLMSVNLDWFIKYKYKHNIQIKKEDYTWFKSIIYKIDFKTQIITKYRLEKLQRILKNKNKI